MSEKRILALDSQILDAIQKCPFYCYLNFIKNWRPNEIGVPIERGDLGHTLLEVYYKLIQKGFTWNEAVEQATIVGREHYLKLDLDLQTAEWVIKNFHEYADYYKNDGVKVLGVEESFSFLLHEDEDLIILYEGKIDLHAKFPNEDKSIYDHKWRAMKADYIGLDNQLIGYSIAENTNIVYINEVGLQKSYPPEKRFRRVPVGIGESVKKRWIKNTIYWAKILDYNIQENVWPQSHLKTPPAGVTQCMKCNYNKICNSENEEMMLEKVQDHFHIGEKWSVHKEVEVEQGE